MEWIIGIVIFVSVIIIFRWLMRVARRNRLMTKYRDKRVVKMIMRKMVWQGQTPEMLVDAIGRPAATDVKVLKTKTKETWKYHRTGRGRYALRVIVENGEVVGWDKKG
ncbi:MAG: DUF2845 domain-containing protein [Phycisphaerales bacterium JB058]